MAHEFPSVTGFAEWLRRQEPEGIIDHTNFRCCAVGQYFLANGVDYYVEPMAWADDVLAVPSTQFRTYGELLAYVSYLGGK